VETTLTGHADRKDRNPIAYTAAHSSFCAAESVFLPVKYSLLAVIMISPGVVKVLLAQLRDLLYQRWTICGCVSTRQSANDVCLSVVWL